MMVAVGLVVATASAARAQDVAAVGSTVPGDQMRARFQIAAMEAVLERAVQLGAQRLSQRVEKVSSDTLFIATAARARGFWLEGYGVFFDVDVPAMRHSMAWSFRQLDRGGQKIMADIRTLQNNLSRVHDPQARSEMEAALQNMQRLVGPPVLPPGMDPGAAAAGGFPPPQPGVVGTRTVTAAAEETRAPAVSEVLDDPGLAYTNEVKAALVDAMLEYGTSIPTSETEWLTIAARDNNDSRIGGDDPYDVTTIVLRVKGSDLAAFKAGRITRDEAVQRVSIKDY
jgi:hypothetical protein